MLVDVLFDTLQNLIGIRPTVKSVVIHLGITEKALYARKARDSELTVEELVKIERGFGLPIGLLSGVNLSDIQLDYYPDILASCGVGCCIPTESKEKIAVTKDIISNYSPSKRYSIVNAYGDSMQPYIHDKDLLIVEHTTEQIKDGRVYIFRYEDALYVKRLVNNITEVIAKSDNAEYKPVILDKKTDDFEVIGQIVGLIRDLR